MNRTEIALLIAFAFAAVTAHAAETAGAEKQTTRMSQCSAEAKDKGLKGDARKEHMSACLRAPGTQAAAKECNAAANEKGLKGNQRKSFVADCIKAKGSVG